MGIASLGKEFQEFEAYRIHDAKSGSDKLLVLLKRHHDANLYPPKGLLPAPKKQPLLPPKPTQEVTSWFRITEHGPPLISEIKSATCRYFKIKLYHIEGERRTADVNYPRQVIMYLAREMTGKSLPRIGRELGNRDHTTVLHGHRKIKKDILKDWTVAYDVAQVEAML